MSHLDSGEGGHDGGGAEAVRDEREVSEMSLNTGVQEGLGPGVAEGGPVLVQQVHQLLRDGSEISRINLRKHSLTFCLLCSKYQVLPPVLLGRVVVQPHHVVRDLSGGELCLTDITKVSSQVYRLSWNYDYSEPQS